MMRAVPYKFIKASAWEDITARLGTVKKEVDQATDFVKQIEQGNLEVRYNGDDQIDSGNLLASSLISMRDRMKRFSLEEKQRNWTTEGLASFVDILRAKNDDFMALADTIVSHLVRYMEANQGALYLVNDDDPQDVFIEMVACYAYDRKKFMGRRIGLGEGMTGQVVLEKQTLYRTDIPHDFVKITSGLGASLPRNLIIVPLVLDQKVYGVMELASFEPIRPYQIEFVEKLGESIAATISSVKGGERTRKLLTETQEQTELMRSQEEEMRQNMEELTATQEEMQRIIQEVQGSEQYVNELLNVSTDSIFTMDRELKLLSCNSVFAATFESRGMSVGKGFEILSLYDVVEKAEKRAMYNRVLNGEIIELTDHITVMGLDNHFMVRHAPLYNKEREIIAMAIFARDVTELVKGRQRAEQLLSEAQHQSEELKAQEEELRQNMEELSATQEEMQRILNEVQAKEGYLTEVLNASQDAIFTVGKDFCIISYNTGFQESIKNMGLTLEKGTSILSFFDNDPVKKEEQRALYTRAFTGERFSETSEFNFNGTTSYHTTSFCPLRKADGEVFGCAIYGRDVTEMTVANKETARLSAAAQQQNEELKAQEEELRQNMEELSATQEEMHRILTEVQRKETYLNELINASSDSIFTIDRDLRMISCNRTFAEGIKNMGIIAEKGLDILTLFAHNPAQQAEHRQQYQRVLNGEAFASTNEFDLNGERKFFTSAYSPLRSEDGSIFGFAVFGKDVTDLMTARLEAERLANAAQQQNEELKAQEEELRQNMEELSATQEEMQRILNEVQAKEQYLTDLINATKDSVVTVDRSYRIVNYNLATEQSYTAQGIKIERGAAMEGMFSDGEWVRYKAHYDRALKGEYFEITDHYHSHGFDAYFRISYSPLRNEKDEVVAVAVFAKNVTAETKAQKELEQNVVHMQEMQAYYNNVIEGMGDSIVTIDRDFKIVVANSAFKNIFSKYGVSCEPGESLLSMAKDREEEFKQPYLKAFAGQSVEEPRRCHFDCHFHVFYHPLRNTTGEVIGVCLIAHDITARIREADAYKERIAQLEKKLKVA